MPSSRPSAFFKFAQLIFFSLFYLTACQHSSKTSSTDSTRSLTGENRKFALLIGIDEYKNLPQSVFLKGCVNDIQEMKQLLQQHGFDNNDITCLTNENATKAAIIQAFKNLEQRAAKFPGSPVYIQFSCHGSQVFDKTEDEPDYLDETLIPYDYIHTHDSAKTTSLLDKELREYLTPISQSTNLAIVIDACHSKGATYFVKTDPLKKSRPLPSIMMAGAPFISITAASTRIRVLPDLITGSEWSQVHAREKLNKPEFTDFHYVLIAACPSDQECHEQHVGLIYYGALTNALYDNLGKLNPGTSWNDFMNQVTKEVQQTYPEQVPQVSGRNINHTVFIN